MGIINKQLQQQNLRELASIKTNGRIRILARLTFLNLMSANGVMAATIIRNYKQKQERKNNVHRQIQSRNKG